MRKAKRIVVKIGSSSVTDAEGRLSPAKIAPLAEKLAHLRQAGFQVILVSSGSVAAGLGKLGWTRSTLTAAQKQAAAAVGQALLIDWYEQLFAAYGLVVAQMLLTRAEVGEGERFFNIRTTVETMLEHGILPIINENDTVTVEENRVGDNDTLGSLVARATGADLLVLLTDIDGLYTADPRQDPAATRLTDIWQISQELEQMAGGNGSLFGTGGMRTKLNAAKIGMQAGIDVVVASSTEPDVLARIVRGEPVGTRFHAGETTTMSERGWQR